LFTFSGLELPSSMSNPSCPLQKAMEGFTREVIELIEIHQSVVRTNNLNLGAFNQKIASLKVVTEDFIKAVDNRCGSSATEHLKYLKILRDCLTRFNGAVRKLNQNGKAQLKNCIEIVFLMNHNKERPDIALTDWGALHNLFCTLNPNQNVCWNFNLLFQSPPVKSPIAPSTSNNSIKEEWEQQRKDEWKQVAHQTLIDELTNTIMRLPQTPDSLAVRNAMLYTMVGTEVGDIAQDLNSYFPVAFANELDSIEDFWEEKQAANCGTQIHSDFERMLNAMWIEEANSCGSKNAGAARARYVATMSALHDLVRSIVPSRYEQWLLQEVASQEEEN